MLTLELELVRNFAIALFIGALVGVEREKRKERSHMAIGGLRTFMLFAMAGAIAAWLALRLTMPMLFPLVGLAVMALLVVGHLSERTQQDILPGLTTETAGIVVYLLGGACIYGYAETAVALAIVTSGLLALKDPLHAAVQKIGPDDLVAGLKLLFATFIILPVLPSQPVDPWGALNPQKLWVLVVLISGLSLAGYVAVRNLGPQRGTALTGLFGALVSSTAVTLSFARASHEQRTTDALAAGILLGWTVMFIRMLAEVAVVYSPLLPALLPPMVAMGLVSAGFAAFYYRREQGSSQVHTDMTLQNPFNLSAAIRFALFFAVILLAIRLVELYQPDGGGVYVVALLAGTTDVDAITLSMANSVRSGGDATQAVQAITLAALANTLVKLGMVLTLAAPALKRKIGFASVVILIVAALTLVFMGAATP